MREIERTYSRPTNTRACQFETGREASGVFQRAAPGAVDQSGRKTVDGQWDVFSQNQARSFGFLKWPSCAPLD